jgi:hypothetical protein
VGDLVQNRVCALGCIIQLHQLLTKAYCFGFVVAAAEPFHGSVKLKVPALI